MPNQLLRSAVQSSVTEAYDRIEDAINEAKVVDAVPDHVVSMMETARNLMFAARVALDPEEES